MRTSQRWNTQYKEKYLRKFPPRIAQDLRTLPIPDDLRGNEAKSTFIYGEIQSGKTIRAAFMIMQELKHLYLTYGDPSLFDKILFVSFSDLLAELKETFECEDKKQSDVMRKYLDAHLLVIDDFLTTRPTDWVTDVLYHLINHRYEYMKKTIITSNYTLEELEKRLQDQRITSRINRMCKIEVKTKAYSL